MGDAIDGIGDLFHQMFDDFMARAKIGCCITVLEIFRSISAFEMDSLGSC